MYSRLTCFLLADDKLGNERLQQMMGIMAQERQGRVFATDERYTLSR